MPRQVSCRAASRVDVECFKSASGKVVIVTGAGSGIGAATARRFALEGAKVVLVGRRREALEAVAHDCGMAAAGQTLPHAADVADQGAVEAMVAATVSRFGHIDVLVNNAGVVPVGPFAEASIEDWRRVMSIDVDGVLFCCRAALPHLLETRGCIVNTSSVSGLGGIGT